MKRKFKIRFHLGAGENYMKWRIEDTTTKNVWFFEPEDFTAVIINGKLHNHPSTAKKINDGANKTVCAWIMAEDVVMYSNENMWMRGQVAYNPRVMPHWIDNNGNNVDKHEYAEMLIDNKKIYTP
jgi:hypothetical protein